MERQSKLEAQLQSVADSLKATERRAGDERSKDILSFVFVMTINSK